MQNKLHAIAGRLLIEIITRVFKIKDFWVSSGKLQNSFKTISRKFSVPFFFSQESNIMRRSGFSAVKLDCHAILKMSPIRPNITICSSNFDRFSNGLGENNMRNLHYGAGIPSRTSDRMLT